MSYEANAQNFSVNELGKWGAASEHLSKKVRWVATNKARLDQFCSKDSDYGKNRGETMDFVLYGDISEARDERSVLDEFEPVPIRKHEMRRISFRATEYGKGMGYTGKAQLLSELTPGDKCTKALRRHHTRTLDKEAYLEMRKCPAQYVATGTAAGTMYTEGTGSVAAAAGSNLNKYHADRIVDFMDEHEALAGENGLYYGIVSVRAARGMKDSLIDIKQYTEKGYTTAAKGEVGTWERVKYVQDNLMLLKSIGTGGVGGEAFFVGRDILLRGYALKMQIRSKSGEDFGRNPALAWYFLGGWKLVHEVEKTGMFRQYRMVRFTSNESVTA